MPTQFLAHIFLEPTFIKFFVINKFNEIPLMVESHIISCCPYFVLDNKAIVTFDTNFLCTYPSRRKCFMIYDKTNFYFHFSSFALFFCYYFTTIPRSFSVEKSRRGKSLSLSGNGKWSKNKRTKRWHMCWVKL